MKAGSNAARNLLPCAPQFRKDNVLELASNLHLSHAGLLLGKRVIFKFSFLDGSRPDHLVDERAKPLAKRGRLGGYKRGAGQDLPFKLKQDGGMDRRGVSMYDLELQKGRKEVRGRKDKVSASRLSSIPRHASWLVGGLAKRVGMGTNVNKLASFD